MSAVLATLINTCKKFRNYTGPYSGEKFQTNFWMFKTWN